MQRTSLSEQLLQPSLLQRLVRANRDAIAPATNLLNGEPMTGGRLAHLNLKLGSWRDRVGPTIAFQRRDAESCGRPVSVSYSSFIRPTVRAWPAAIVRVCDGLGPGDR